MFCFSDIKVEARPITAKGFNKYSMSALFCRLNGFVQDIKKISFHEWPVFPD